MLIKRLEFSGYRGIDKAELDGLAPLTILVGPNGSGKSSVLEAACLVCAGASAEMAFGVLASREWMGLEGIDHWFDREKGLKLRGWTSDGSEVGASFEIGPPYFFDQPTLRDGGSRSVLELRADSSLRGTGQVRIDGDGEVIEGTNDQVAHPFALFGSKPNRPAGAKRRFSAPVFSSDLREALKRIKLSPWYDDFLAYLQELRPSVVSVESIAVGDRDEPFVFEGAPRRGFPIAYAGDGFSRLLEIAAALASARGGVAALDEPESHAHPSMIAGLGKLIRRATREDTQVLVATHSLELVRGLLTAFEDDPSAATVVGLRLESGVLDPVFIHGPDAYERVVNMADDLRL